MLNILEPNIILIPMAGDLSMLPRSTFSRLYSFTYARSPLDLSLLVPLLLTVLLLNIPAIRSSKIFYYNSLPLNILGTLYYPTLESLSSILELYYR